MTAIVSSNTLGLISTSLNTLGASSLGGSAEPGTNEESVFVNAANGNLVLQSQDEILKARGLDVELLRTYNSQGVTDGDNNDNWRIGFYRQIDRLTGSVNSTGSTVVRVDADGANLIYSWNGSIYINTDGSGSYDTLSYNAKVLRWTWTDGDTGVQETYDWNKATGYGKLLSQSDPSGSLVSYSYNSDGLLTRVSTASYENIYLDYIGTLLKQVRTETLMASDAMVTSCRTRYGYDKQNRLVSVTVDLTPGDNSTADDKTYITTYTYDGTSNRIASLTQTDGTWLRFAYDTMGRIRTITDALGNVTLTEYDSTNRVTTVTDALGKSTLYAYDSKSQLSSVASPMVNGVSAVHSYKYNDNGDVTRVVDGQGRATNMIYDDNGNQLVSRDNAGNTVRRTYNSANQVLTETVYLVPDPDGAGPAQPETALTTNYVWDAAGKNLLRFEISPEGRVKEHQYNGYGQRISSIAYATTRYTAAAITEQALSAWVGQIADKSQAMRTDVSWDFRGQIAYSKTYASTNSITGQGVTPSTTIYVYSSSGELLQSISPLGGAAQTETRTYDGLHRLLTVTNGLGQLTQYQYNDALDGSSLRYIHDIAPNGLRTSSAYDRVGRLISVERSAGTALLGKTRYCYDNNNRLFMTQDPTGVCTWTLYDAAGRLVGEVDGNGSLTETQYDKSDRIIKTIRYSTPVNLALLEPVAKPGSPGGIAPPATASLYNLRPGANAGDWMEWKFYDNAGRLSKTVDQQGSVTEIVYDGNDRVTSTIEYVSLFDTSTIEAMTIASEVVPPAPYLLNNRITRSFYDKDGLLLATVDPEGAVREIVYNAAGQAWQTIAYAAPLNVVVHSNLLPSSTVDSFRPASNSNDIRTYTLYDAQGQVMGEVDGEGYLTEYRYDPNGNLVRTTRYAQPVSASIDVNSTLSSVRPATTSQAQVRSMSYDALDRLETETGIDGTVTRYGYDTAGNLITTVRAERTVDQRTTTKGYDDFGRLTSERDGRNHQTIFTYDSVDRLTSSTDPLGYRILYYYDVDGQLVHTINALGEIEGVTYDTLERKSAVTRYSRIIDADTLADLRGGLLTQTVRQLIDGLADPEKDSTLRYDWNSDGTMCSSTDARGNITTYQYNTFGEQTAIISPTYDSYTLLTTSEYDRRGQLRHQTVHDANAGSNDITVTTEYDAFGRISSSIDGRTYRTRIIYDKLGRTVQTIDALNASSWTSYDAFDRRLTMTDASGKVTTFSYVTEARSVSVTSPEGISVTTTSNRHGQQQSVTDGRNNTSTYAYNGNGDLEWITLAGGGLIHNIYDDANRLVESTDANNVVTRFTYDAAGRMATRSVDPGGLNLITSYGWDTKGQQASITDPNQIVTLLNYDPDGNLLERIVDPGGLNLTTRYAYDKQDNQLSVTEAAGTSVARTTVYAYDKAGRRILETIDPNGLNILTRYEYDNNDNLVCKTDANGFQTRYVYDQENRLRYQVEPLSQQRNASASLVVQGAVKETIYDAMGRVTSTIAYANPISLYGLPTHASIAGIAEHLQPDNTRDSCEAFVYDSDGRMVYTIGATGSVSKTDYDANGNVIRVTSYDNAYWDPSLNRAWSSSIPAPSEVSAMQDKVIPVAWLDQTRQYVYDAANRQVYSIDGTGAVVKTDYDSNGNVLRETAYANKLPDGNSMRLVNLASGSQSVGQIYLGQFNAGDVVTMTAYFRGDTNQVAGMIQLDAYNDSGVYLRNYNSSTSSDGDWKKLVITASISQSCTLRAWIMGDPNTNRPVGQAGYYDNVTVSSLQRGVVLHEDFESAAWGRGTQHLSNRPAVVDTQAKMEQLLVVDTDRDHSEQYFYDAANRKIYAVDGVGAVTKTDYYANGNVFAETAYASPLAGGNALKLSNLQGTGNEQRIGPVALGSFSAGDVVTVTAYFRGDSNQVTGRIQLDAFEGGTWRWQRGSSATDNGDWQKLSVQVELTQACSIDLWIMGDQNSNRPLGQAGYYDNVMVSSAQRGVLVDERFDLAAWGRGTLDQSMPQPVIDNMAELQRLIAAHPARDRATTYYYDAAGRKTGTDFTAVGVYEAESDPQMIANGAAGAARRTDLQTSLIAHSYYDALGNLVASRNAAGYLHFRAYDHADRLVYDVDEERNVTYYDYDDMGNVITLTRYAQNIVDANGNPITWDPTAAPDQATLAALLRPNSADRTITSRYNARGQVVEIIEPEVYAYSQRPGGVVRTTSSPRTMHDYDTFGQRVRTQTLRTVNGDQWIDTDQYWISSYSYYDRAGNETASVDAGGYLTTRMHDSFGNVISTYEHFAAVSSANMSTYTVADTGGRAVNYQYDRANRRLTESRLAHFSSDSLGTSQTGNLIMDYAYDAFGNQVRVREADFVSGVMRYHGSVLTYYDGENRIKAITTPTRAIAGNDNFTGLTEYFRDAYGNVVQQVERANGATGYGNARLVSYGTTSTGADRISTSIYDNWGRLMETADASASRDWWGRLVQSTEELGKHRYWSYDAAGNLAKHWATVTNPDGTMRTLFKRYVYDRVGRLTAMLDPASSAGATQSLVKTQMRYNAFGELVSRGIRNMGNNWSEYFDFDSNGRLWRTNSGDGVNKVMLYDLQGRQTAEIRGAENSGLNGAAAADMQAGTRRIDKTYDDLGRMLTEVQAARAFSTHPSVRPRIERTYDRWGNLLTVSDPTNSTTTIALSMEYDESDHLIRETRPSFTYEGTTTAVTPVREFYYDYAGRQVAVRDGNGHVSGTRYDDMGNVIEELHADREGANSGKGIVRYGYNAFGEKVQRTDAEGYVTDYLYDKLGNLKLEQRPAAEYYAVNARAFSVDPATAPVTGYNLFNGAGPLFKYWAGTYRYSDLGGVLQYTRSVKVSPNWKVTAKNFEGDSWSAAAGNTVLNTNITGDGNSQAGNYVANYLNELRVEYNGSDRNINPVQWVSSTRSQISTDYNELGQKIRVTNPAGQVVTYRYDLRGNIVRSDVAGAPSVSSTWDALGRKTSETSTDGYNNRTEWQYDYFGRLDRKTFTNSDVPFTTVYTYDEYNQLRREQLGPWRDVTYDYDQAGQLLKIIDKIDDDTWRQTTYSYDLAGRRKTERVVIGSRNASGDVTGTVYQDNILNYDTSGQLISVGSGSFGSLHYRYDAAGNRVYQRETFGNGARESYFEYDEMNRMKMVDGVPDGSGGYASRTVITYDRNGNRKSETLWEGANSRVTTFDWDGLGRLVGLRKNGVTSNYRYDLADRIVAQDLGSFDSDGGMKTQVNRYDSNGRLSMQAVILGVNYGYGAESLTHNAEFDGVGNIKEAFNYRTNHYSLTHYNYRNAPEGIRQNFITTTQWSREPSAWDENDSGQRRTDATTEFYYDLNGHLTSVFDDGKTVTGRFRNFFNDANGVLLAKQTTVLSGGAATNQNLVARNLVVSGQVLGRYGQEADDAGNTRTIRELVPFTAVDPGFSSGSQNMYRVNAGDSLRSIALAMYGDAELWYLIADANGLAGDSVRAGESLVIPRHFGAIHNRNDTVRPYSSSALIGNTDPSVPAPIPSEPNQCNTVGIIVAAVVASMVVNLLASAATAATMGSLGPVFGALGGGLGSMAYQGIMIAGGLQPAMDWKMVGAEAVGGAVSGGAASLMAAFGKGVAVSAKAALNTGRAAELTKMQRMLGASWKTAATAFKLRQFKVGVREVMLIGKRGTLYGSVEAASEALSQGISYATGLQDSFNWAQVTAAWISGKAIGKQSSNTDLSNLSTRQFFRSKQKEIVDKKVYSDMHAMVLAEDTQAFAHVGARQRFNNVSKLEQIKRMKMRGDVVPIDDPKWTTQPIGFFEKVGFKVNQVSNPLRRMMNHQNPATAVGTSVVAGALSGVTMNLNNDLYRQLPEMFKKQPDGKKAEWDVKRTQIAVLSGLIGGPARMVARRFFAAGAREARLVESTATLAADIGASAIRHGFGSMAFISDLLTSVGHFQSGVRHTAAGAKSNKRMGADRTIAAERVEIQRKRILERKIEVNSLSHLTRTSDDPDFSEASDMVKTRLAQNFLILKRPLNRAAELRQLVAPGIAKTRVDGFETGIAGGARNQVHMPADRAGELRYLQEQGLVKAGSVGLERQMAVDSARRRQVVEPGWVPDERQQAGGPGMPWLQI